MGAEQDSATDPLFAQLYEELREMAHRQLARGRPGETLNTTALVHEVYLKLHQGVSPPGEDRRHFLRLSARAMRQVIIDAARRRGAEVHGGGVRHISLESADIPQQNRIIEVLALQEALTNLEALNPRLGQVVDMIVFSGLSVPETAELLGFSESTIKRDWRLARAYLYTELSRPIPVCRGIATKD